MPHGAAAAWSCSFFITSLLNCKTELCLLLFLKWLYLIAGYAKFTRGQLVEFREPKTYI